MVPFARAAVSRRPSHCSGRMPAHAGRCGRGTDVTSSWQTAGNLLPVETTVDSMGRIVVPKPLRDALGLTPGTRLDVSRYGAGLHLVPAGRTARLRTLDGALVADSSTEVTDDLVFGVLDSGRR